MASNHLSCAYHDRDGILHTWVEPVSVSTYRRAVKLVWQTSPLWFKCILIVAFVLIFLPKGLPMNWSGLPFYTIFYLMFGTHFFFPRQLKKYHGAEHKVFSTKGLIHQNRLYAIKRASIKNRGCSTGLVVVYFLTVLCLAGIGSFFVSFEMGLAASSYVALLFVGLYHLYRNKPFFHWCDRVVLPISYWLQVYVTTSEPERKQLECAIASYRTLGYRVFSEPLRHAKIERRRKKKMAIADVAIVPIGTDSPSVSSYVAEIQNVLEDYAKKQLITYQLTPMSTLIEAEIATLFDVLKAIHDVPFQHGALRVYTNIRIDERRDKPSTLQGKLNAVQAQMEKKQDNER